MLAMAFTFSCSSDDGDGGGGGSSPSVGGKSSSSNKSSISECNGSPIIGAGGKGNDIANYNTVPIGTQVWMAENLDYAVECSKCYDDDPANCATHGRLYSWITAMALPASCEKNYCASQINAKHRGICPEGWHIPSDEDWGILMDFVLTDNEETYRDDKFFNVAKYLKATSGWGIYASNDEGKDTYGFAALPGGYYYSSDLITVFNFSSIRDEGHWWSSTEIESKDIEGRSSKAYGRTMKYGNITVTRDEYSKIDDNGKWISVRCLKD